MSIPARVPIQYERDAAPTCCGHYDDGQFFGSVINTYVPDRSPDDWRTYAVLHLFDPDGVHERSEIWWTVLQPGEDSPAHEDRADARLREWLSNLPGRANGDIAIGLFKTTVDGDLFGLVDQSDEYGHDHAELVPDNLGFDPPWTGEFDT